MKLPNPNKLSDADLWWVIQNVFTNRYGCPLKLKNWYQEVKEEFYNRDIKLSFIISAK